METIYKVHARLMENARFGMSYTPPGELRNITRKSVIIDTERGCIECCPYVAVERELSHICDEASVCFLTTNKGQSNRSNRSNSREEGILLLWLAGFIWSWQDAILSMYVLM